jgi:Ca2+-binding EF-hand superfamily protein
MSTILEELRMLFYKIAEKDDKNPDAVLSLETFKKGYKLYFVPTPDAEIEKFFKKLDADNDGFIDA